MNITELKVYLELAIMIIIAISSIIILFKLLFKKIDKNQNGKIEQNEITDADMQFLKEMLSESIATIAQGMLTLNGVTGKKAYTMLINEVKSSKAIFDTLQKNQEKEKSQNEKK